MCALRRCEDGAGVYATVVKLVDTRDLKSRVRKGVRVRFPSVAPPCHPLARFACLCWLLEASPERFLGLLLRKVLEDIAVLFDAQVLISFQ
jgi:hypothetical protein